MFGARDVVWSIAICAALTLMLQCRPAWSARRFIEHDAKAGFLQDYAGHLYLNGEVIVPEGGGAQVDPMAAPVVSRQLEITAERTAFIGNKAEFVVRHLIQLEGAGKAGSDASQEVHVQLKKQGGVWIYTLFEIRGRGLLSNPNSGNPWARALDEG